MGTQKLIGYTGETLIPNYRVPQGYEIISSPQPNVTVDATGKQIIQVNVSHKISQSAETLTKIRTINIHLPNATVKTYRQVAVIKRSIDAEEVTAETENETIDIFYVQN